MFSIEPCLRRDVSVPNEQFGVSLEKRIVIIFYAYSKYNKIILA